MPQFYIILNQQIFRYKTFHAFPCQTYEFSAPALRNRNYLFVVGRDSNFDPFTYKWVDLGQTNICCKLTFSPTRGQNKIKKLLTWHTSTIIESLRAR